MNSKIRLEFDVQWLLNPEKMTNDPLAKELRDLGKIIPYRIYLEPTGELLSDRVFDLSDPYYIHEVHFLDIDSGQWSVRCEELTGWLKINVENMRLNTVNLRSNEFVLE